jgi:L-ascorbate metabolism protein UlaG (beta-lactamase superfamily)
LLERRRTLPVDITYHGHATLTLATDGVQLVVDPFFSPNNPLAPVSVDAIEADYILISHGHADHIADAAALAKRTRAHVISNPEIIGWLAEQGVENGHGMNTGGAYTFPFGRVKFVVAHHSSALPDGANGGNPCGIVFQFNDGHDVYFAGDTSLTYDMKLIGEAGGVDLALLPIGDNFTMGPDDAVKAAQFVQAKHVIPIHYDTFPPIRQNPDAFAAKLRETTEIDCTVLKPGDTFTLG